MSVLSNKKGSTLRDIIISFLIVFVVFLFLGFIVLPSPRRTATASTCESNMKQIGNAIKMYMSDWDYHLPTNRAYIDGRHCGPVSPYVELSDPQPSNSSVKGLRYQRGINWVEGLYKYMAMVNRDYKRNDPSSVFQCPVAKGPAWPKRLNTAVTSYALNANLLERSESKLWNSACLMMVRELDRPTGSALRPVNNTTGTTKSCPISPFLNGSDKFFGKIETQLHANGSHILFADGHVKLYSKDFFPSDSEISKEKCWDAELGVWFNYAKDAQGVPRYYQRAIAITP